MYEVNHTLYQPEGHRWKLGRHPCYDPQKARGPAAAAATTVHAAPGPQLQCAVHQGPPPP